MTLCDVFFSFSLPTKRRLGIGVYSPKNMYDTHPRAVDIRKRKTSRQTASGITKIIA